MKEKWVRSLFPNLLFLFPVSKEELEMREAAIPSLPTTPVPRDGEQPSDINLGSRRGAHTKGSAQVLAVVLKCC